jgi:hypothetical protein
LSNGFTQHFQGPECLPRAPLVGIDGSSERSHSAKIDVVVATKTRGRENFSVDVRRQVPGFSATSRYADR